MKKIIDGSDLLSQNPDVAAEWHPNKNGSLSPSDVFANSNKKAWWLGKCNHEWQAVICTRNKGVGCPFCSNKRVLKGFNDLAFLYPSIAQEWHPSANGELQPDEVTAGSDKIVWWHGKCGHNWKQRIANRKNGQGCPICKRNNMSKVMSAIHIKKGGALSDSSPDLLEEWHPTRNIGITPDSITAGSATIVWWLGKCGHEWQASPSNRSKGTNCPFCSNQKVLAGFNDLQTLNSDIAQEWHPSRNGSLLPTQVTPGSNKQVWWQGTCGHEWLQSISKRCKMHRGCPECARKLQTSFPEQAIFFYVKQFFPDSINSYHDVFGSEMELDIFIPSLKTGIEYDGSQWHTSAEVQLRDSNKYELCRKNGIRLIRIVEDFNDSDSLLCDFIINISRHPSAKVLNQTIIFLLRYLTNSKDEYTVDTERDGLAIREQYITGSTSSPFSERFPELLLDWDFVKNGNLNPSMFSQSSGTPVCWKCHTCGHEWIARIATRTSGSGCIKCGYIKRTQSRLGGRVSREGSFVDLHPQLGLEWDYVKNTGLSPDTFLSGSTKLVWWKCSSCHHEWEATIASRSKGSKCPECLKTIRANKRKELSILKNGSLEQNNPTLSLEWNYERNTFTPKEIAANSHTCVWWTCSKCGNVWLAEIKARNKGAGCPHCKVTPVNHE